MTQLFNRIIADLGVYEVVMAYLAIALFALVALCFYQKYLAKVARKRAERLARIRSTVAWLRQNIHLPKRLPQRKEHQVVRTERWAREKAEELARINRAKYVRQTLDVFPLLISAHRAPTMRRVRPS